MNAAWAWALLWAAAPAAREIDCSNVEPAPVADPAAARAYLEVGDAERRQGSLETAALAFREAIRLDPSSAPARARLVDLCQAGGQDEVIARAARAVEEERYGEAVALLGPRYREGGRSDPSTALLYGIALYERGEDAAALEALERAQQSPETQDPASVFLGLLALRAGDTERAVAQFARADRSAQGGLSRTARELSTLATKNARLAVSVEAEGGYDSNVSLFPDPTGFITAPGDVLYGGMVSALLRPLGERGPYAVAGGRVRNLAAFSEYDLGWASGAAGYRLGRGRDELRAEYAYDAIWLGHQPFMTAHQVQLDGRLEAPFGRLGGLVSARAETYLTVPYSGPTLDGEASLGWAWSRGELRLRYRGQWHRSGEEAKSWLEHGPGVEALATFSSLRLVLDARVTSRAYGAAEPGFGNVVRQDVYLDAAVSLERDLVPQLSFYLSLGGRRAFSNVHGSASSLEYARLSGSAGAIFTAGLW